jgi:hypothetical protein
VQGELSNDADVTSTTVSAIAVSLVMSSLSALHSFVLQTTAQKTTGLPNAEKLALAVEQPKKAEAPLPMEVEFEFSDVNALTCLLCARQFKTLDQLKRHNKESDLHKARLLQYYDDIWAKVVLTIS